MLILCAIGVAAIFLNFHIKASPIKFVAPVRLVVIAFMLLCTFPIAAATYLLVKKYKLRELELNLRPPFILLAGLLTWAITGVFAMLFNYEDILWKRGYEELGGVFGMLMQGVIGAALAEEFWRFVLQTRLNRFIKNCSLCILITSTIWALMHFPDNYSNSGDTVSTITIVYK
jgi:membrane protease YdiL (CAAX protease family)